MGAMAPMAPRAPEEVVAGFSGVEEAAGLGAGLAAGFVAGF